jgi:hypothetical protein
LNYGRFAVVCAVRVQQNQKRKRSKNNQETRHTQALAGGGKPNIRLVIFTAGENQIAVTIVFQICDGTLVALEKNWSLRE